MVSTLLISIFHPIPVDFLISPVYYLAGKLHETNCKKMPILCVRSRVLLFFSSTRSIHFSSLSINSCFVVGILCPTEHTEDLGILAYDNSPFFISEENRRMGPAQSQNVQCSLLLQLIVCGHCYANCVTPKIEYMRSML